MQSIRSAVLVIGAVAGLTFSATAAYADAYVGYDSYKDVQLGFDDGNGSGYSRAPNRVIGDINQIRVAHTLQKVRISMTYRDLVAGGDGALHEFTVGSSNGGAVVDIQGVPGHWPGRPTFYRNGKKTCSAVFGRIDYTNNRVIVEFPRSCLDNPSWVQVAGMVNVGTRNGSYDDWSMNSGLGNAFTRRVHV